MLDAITSMLAILFWTVGGAIALLLYFLPSIIVLARRADGMAVAVIVLNLFLGWTFLGWVVCLALSVAGSPAPRHPVYAVYPQLPASHVQPSNGVPPAIPSDVTAGDAHC
jgi:RsiW-degrading membrane proteinase PrsW (M82 family)